MFAYTLTLEEGLGRGGVGGVGSLLNRTPYVFMNTYGPWSGGGGFLDPPPDCQLESFRLLRKFFS